MSDQIERCGWCGDIKQGSCGCPAESEIERLSADRDTEKRLRKDSDDLATDLRLALEAVMSRPSDTGLAWAVLERIHGAPAQQPLAAA